MSKLRLFCLAAVAVGFLTASPALASPMTYGIDVEIQVDNGYGLPAGTYVGAGSVTLDVPASAPAGYSGATLLSLELMLGADTWTLADATTPGGVAGVLLDGAPVGVVYFGLNANGHVVALDFDPEALGVADITEPEANRFALGTYSLADSPSVPEPGAALLFGAGLLVAAARVRRD